MENINQGIGEMGAVNHRPHQQQGLAHKSLPETTSSLRQSDSAGISPRSRLHHHKYFINQKAVPEDGRELGSFVKILYQAGKKEKYVLAVVNMASPESLVCLSRLKADE
jgi:hypothetical protein